MCLGGEAARRYPFNDQRHSYLPRPSSSAFTTVWRFTIGTNYTVSFIYNNVVPHAVDLVRARLPVCDSAVVFYRAPTSLPVITAYREGDMRSCLMLLIQFFIILVYIFIFITYFVRVYLLICLCYSSVFFQNKTNKIQVGSVSHRAQATESHYLPWRWRRVLLIRR